ncbi:pentapeptide repeat-containing protein [Enterobacter ludwigii]|uniref:pentapeptide repeat-containing protein n=1 Tax=Enterobacter ludwigii TaxID=299767 RepID=UPI003917835E
MIDSGREKISDKKFDSSISNETYINKLFERLVALNIEFKNIDFRYCIFDAAYIRKCSFDNCNFTGCRFINCNFTGTSFNGCKFDYASFDKTHIDNDILDVGCPGPENLKLKFARSLRVNYQQIGDSKSANKAIAIELQATEAHLHKAWDSNESYYRQKYKGRERFYMYLEWIQFKALDIVWGNGESTIKLIRAVMIIILLMSLNHVWCYGDVWSVKSYLDALEISPQILLGTLTPSGYATPYITLITFVRLVMFGFFMSIIIKRFNRR